MVAITDARGRFLYIDCRFPGRCHDSAIWTRSDGSRLFEDGHAAPGYRLLGDSGFRNSSSVVTPYRDAAARADERKAAFNLEHSHARIVVEQAFGTLKRRFPLLYNVARLEPPTLQLYIVASVVLYNIGITLEAQNGQPLSGRLRATVLHPPPGSDVRDFMMSNM
ncbi:hypothetical protein ANCCAN_08223 [Ancylostoma caninum]|uniref:DDE Tnp4 domain-containing protein n=1 Tax=Ancylostoma caninum TaxID=29170 RepID=A0A368GN18_ANCCA|nr:hypothetical protein ANCCAN_08223 [Ancylostoma caninum]